MKRKISILLAGALLGSTLLSGCQGRNIQESLPEETETQVQEVDYRSLFWEMEPQEYMAGNWKAEKPGNPTHYMKSAEQLPQVFMTENEKIKVSAEDTVAAPDSYYGVLYLADTKEARPDWALATFDYKTHRTEYTSFRDKMYAYEYSFVRGLSVSAGQVVIYNQKFDKDGKFEGLFACDWKEDTIQEGVNLFPAMEEFVDTPAAWFFMEMDMEYEAANGQYCLISKEGSRIAFINKDGTLAGVHEEERARFSFFLQTPEGLWLFQKEANADGQAEIFYFNEQGEKKILYQGTTINCKAACVDDKGNIIYVDAAGKNLIEWHVLTGERSRIFGAVGENLKYPAGIHRDEDGEIYVFDDSSRAMGMTHIVTAGEAVEAVIKVQPLCWYPDYIKDSLETYATTHPGITFEYAPEVNWDNRDVGLAKMYTEISEGGGPDLMVLLRENLEGLGGKNCLMNLSDVISQENQDIMMESMLQNGYLGDKLYLLTLSGTVEADFIMNDTFDKDTWNVTEFMDTVEAMDAKTPLKAAVCTSWCWFRPGMLLNKLTYDLEGEGLVNLETGESDLNGEKFRRILQFCKKYGKEYDGFFDSQGGEKTGMELLRSGAVAVLADANGAITDFSSYMKGIGEEGRLMNWPGTSGGIFSGEYGLAVNVNTPYRDIIEDILNTILSKEYTLEYIGFEVPLRKDTFDGRITNVTDYSEGRAQVRLDSRSYLMIDSKPDGTSYINEYIEFLNNARPVEETLDRVREIIEEEAEGYFYGDKSLDAVLDVMQSRVRLYLKERL